MYSVTDGTAVGVKGAPRNANVSCRHAAALSGDRGEIVYERQLMCRSVQPGVTLTHVFCWLVALVASVAALSWASLMFLSDREQPAALFAAGGLALIPWLAFRVNSL